ncbi:hypothetical protein X742_24265 [Mesorhizobium sp. LNHC232B00]|nr:hypothetical protein X742_24265 [Mesorhizobium sp. LNHC232B00]
MPGRAMRGSADFDSYMVRLKPVLFAPVLSVDASAAPHLPAGILSPYSDGERGSRQRFRQLIYGT